MVQPVVVRELQVRSRSAATYYVRLGAAAAPVMVGALVLFLSGLAGGAWTVNGGRMLEVVLRVLVTCCLLEGIRQASGGLCEERREGTLGLLFLTDLTGTDVVLGKFAGTVISAAYALLAMLPIVAVAVLFGGVTGGEVVRLFAALPVILSVSLACGIWASARTADGMVAMGVALGMLFGLCVLPMALDFVVFRGAAGPQGPEPSLFGLASPLTLLALIRDQPGSQTGARFLGSLGIQVALVVSLVALAGRGVRRTWRPETCPQVPLAQGAHWIRMALRAGGQLEADFGDVTAHRLQWARWSRVLVGLALLMVALSVPMDLAIKAGLSPTPWMQLPLMLLALSRHLLLMWMAARVFSDLRRHGELEILLTTPLREADLVGQVWRRMRPVVLVLTVLDGLTGALRGVLMNLPNLTGRPPGVAGDVMGVVLASSMSNGLINGFMLWATVWVAFWLGLRTGRTPAAVGLTFGGVMVLTAFLGQFLLMVGVSYLWSRVVGTFGPNAFSVRSGESASMNLGYVVWTNAPTLISGALLCTALALWSRWARHRLLTRMRSFAG